MSNRPAMRIAVIGSGISGLVAAEHLHHRHDITVFEAGDHAGGHTNTIKVTVDGEEQHIDTGFIVYNEVHYPRFTELLRRFGVESQPTSMSFSVRDEASNMEYNGTSLNGLFSQRRNALRPSFLRMLLDILRFGREAPHLLEASSPESELTVEEYVDRHGYSRYFVEHYLIPLGAALWSSPAKQFRTFPMAFVVAFLNNHCMLQIGGRPVWRVIKGGSFRYVQKLTAGFTDRIRTRCPVRAIRRTNLCVDIQTADGKFESFDHAVIACHADQALRLLADPKPIEQELLSAFPYQPNVAILHTDTSILPRNRRTWASWNTYMPTSDTGQVAVTYNMNILQSLQSRHTFCVTLNESDLIDESKIIRRIRYHHPIYTSRQAEAQSRHEAVACANRTSFCGAYWGFGFHEDGVRSAQTVCDAIDRHPVDTRLEVAHA